MKIIEVENDTNMIIRENINNNNGQTAKRSSKSYTICLNMIVKNESHIIEKTLVNLCSYIDFDAYYISDTGSTDNTISIIRDFFNKRNIPGEIEQVAWHDFGFNRTLSLQMAFQKTDYLLIFDADDAIHGDFVLPDKLTHDAYQLKLGESFVYVRTLIVNNRKRWKFVGVLHEYIACIDKEESSAIIEGSYYVESGRSGNRSSNPNKYINDATVLEKGYMDEMDGYKRGDGSGDKNLAERYTFYCAQSYMDAGVAYIDKSIEWYLRVLEQHNWGQEKYYSALCLGNLYARKGDKYNSLKFYCKTMEYDEERIEGIASTLEILRADGNHVMVNSLYHKYKNYNKNPTGKLFLARDKYQDIIEYTNSISAFYIFDKRSGYDCCKTIIQNNLMDHHYLVSTFGNIVFYTNFFEQDTIPNLLRLFYSVDNLLSVVASKNDSYSVTDFDIWTQLFNKVRHCLTASPKIYEIEEEYLPGASSDTIRPEDDLSFNKPIITKYKLKLSRDLSYLNQNTPVLPESPVYVTVNRNRTKHIQTIITFTTCKRLDLFQETVNSIINMWRDVSQIDYWYCVDDNSSEEDRMKMKAIYPFIDFYMKTPDEKGHRPSMNIIWNKLEELKPNYWIHMEDDFLFHTPGTYVKKPIQMMNDARRLGHNVRQILYNRNYGETIKDYNIQGHKIIRDIPYDVAVHVHKTGNFEYGNNHYWPHYSFRPSFIDVNAVLILGNYDSANQFFEMDYANRWFSNGFLSGFYNQITNRHIGRLTSERHDNKLPNAYDLNDENQFVAKEAEGEQATTTPTENIILQSPLVSPTVNDLSTKKYYSTQLFDDGFGAQYQRFIWTCIYAEDHENDIFIYRTPEKIAHNYNADPKFIDKMEDLMNMKGNYLDYKTVMDANSKADLEGNSDNKIAILIPNFYDIFKYVERNIDKCMKSESMARIKKYFWANKQRQDIYAGYPSITPDGKRILHLAVHIRRPNIDDTKANGGEEYDNAYYIRSLLTIRNKYAENKPDHVITIHIYSQGATERFTDFINHPLLRENVILHLNDGNEETYLGMAGADILITSASSFSYSAAFVSDADIFYTDFWHKPCSWWNILSK
jgi:hypothetical protein